MGSHFSVRPKMSWRTIAIQKLGAAMPSVETSMMRRSASLPWQTAARVPIITPSSTEKSSTQTASEPVMENAFAISVMTGFFWK